MYSGEDLYVVFTKGKRLGILKPFLHSSISHCFVMWANGDKWLVYDQSAGYTSIFTLDDYNGIIKDSIIVKVKARPQHKMFMGINTCVESVKRLIGISNWCIFTPYQLYKRIK